MKNLALSAGNISDKGAIDIQNEQNQNPVSCSDTNLVSNVNNSKEALSNPTPLFRIEDK